LRKNKSYGEFSQMNLAIVSRLKIYVATHYLGCFVFNSAAET